MKVTKQEVVVLLRRLQAIQRKLLGQGIFVDVTFEFDSKTKMGYAYLYVSEQGYTFSESLTITKHLTLEEYNEFVTNVKKGVSRWITQDI